MQLDFRGRRKKADPKTAAIAIVVAIAAAANGFFTRSGARVHRGVADDSHGSMTLYIGLAIACALVPIVILVIRNNTRNGDEDDHPRTDDMKSTDRESGDENEDDLPRKLIILAAVVAVAIGAMLVIFSQPASAQGSRERGAFVALNGADTVVVDRFVRTADSLTGSVSIKGQARVEYAVALGPSNTVRAMRIRQFKWNAAPTDAPSAEVLTTMRGDSAIFEMGGRTTAMATKAGAIPSFGNTFALTELYTRSARATGGNGDYSMLALNGGATYPVAVRAAGNDSELVTVVGQTQRLSVDAAGRILGGTISGQPVVIVRASAAESDKITFGSASAKPAEKPDYSAPPGAPYTAAEVSFAGPGGITLGGTLTKPKNARGPLPAVVTITGSGQQDRDEYIPLVGGVRVFRQVADTLSRVGIAVLRLDDRGIGASTGVFANSTTADFADDVRAALAWLRARSDIDPNRIALVGHSEGGMIAPMVAATDPRLRAITIMAGPAETMTDIMLAQNKWVADHNPKFTAAQRDSVLAEARATLVPEKQIAPAVKFWLSYDPAPAAKKVKASTLILQGETDRQVPVANAEKLAAMIRSGGNKDVTVRVFPETDHLFLADPTGDFLDMYKHVKTNKVSSAILGAMADWLVARLGAKPAM